MGRFGRLWTKGGTAVLLCDMQERFVPLIQEMDSVVRVASTMVRVSLPFRAFLLPTTPIPPFFPLQARTAWVLGLPVVATEQYPKAFGPTVSPLCDFVTKEEPFPLPTVPPSARPEGVGDPVAASEVTRAFGALFEKTAFSMCSPALEGYLSEALSFRTAQLGEGGEGQGLDVEEGALRRVVVCGIETHVCVTATALDFLEKGVEVHVVTDGVSSQRLGDRRMALRRLERAGAFLTTAESAMLHLVGDAKDDAFKAISKLLIQHNKQPSKLLEIDQNF